MPDGELDPVITEITNAVEKYDRLRCSHMQRYMKIEDLFLAAGAAVIAAIAAGNLKLENPCNHLIT